MADSIVIYKSKCGSTEQYAKWIAEKIGADILTRNNSVTDNDIIKYQNIIFGMPIYQGRLYGAEMLESKLSLLKDKNIFLFVVGMTELDSYSRNAAIISSFTKKARKIIRVYQLRGNYIFRKLSLKSRMDAYLLHNQLQYKLKKNAITVEEEELLYSLREKQKWIDKESINPIIEAVKNPPPMKEMTEDSEDGLFIIDKKGELHRS